MDIFYYLKLPFAYVLEWLTTNTGSFALALFLFALLVKIILFPASAKSKKSMMKMSRVTPKVKALEAQYADDKQKYQEEVNKLYKEEGVSTCGGCIWSLLPLILLIPLYEIIRQPITWQILHGSTELTEALKALTTSAFDFKQTFFGVGANAAEVSAAVRAAVPGIARAVALKTSNGAYWEMSAITKLPQIIKLIQTTAPATAELLKNANPVLTNPDTFSLFGINLSAIPEWKLWATTINWNSIGLFLIPVISGAFNFLSMFISQKMNDQVVVDDKGEKDADMAKASQSSTKAMTYTMPLMSVVFGFMFPAGLSIYWIAQAVVGILQDYFLTKHYKKVYDAEDEVKRQKAADEAAQEVERERIRAEKRAANPEGIVENTSKKKIEQQKKAEKAAAEAAYLAKKAEERGETPEETVKDSKRPFSRGRAYRADRYEEQDSNDLE